MTSYQKTGNPDLKGKVSFHQTEISTASLIKWEEESLEQVIHCRYRYVLTLILQNISRDSEVINQDWKHLEIWSQKKKKEFGKLLNC